MKVYSPQRTQTLRTRKGGHLILITQRLTKAGSDKKKRKKKHNQSIGAHKNRAEQEDAVYFSKCYVMNCVL